MPYYDLNQVRVAALAEKVEFRGRNVGRDIANLGYDLSDVINCLIGLSEADFHKTHKYENGDIDDAYRFEYKKQLVCGDIADSLYIKFCLFNDCLEIDLASFHLNR